MMLNVDLPTVLISTTTSIIATTMLLGFYLRRFEEVNRKNAEEVVQSVKDYLSSGKGGEKSQ